MKAIFSGGGRIQATYEASIIPQKIHFKELPGIDPGLLSRAPLSSFYGILEHHAKEIGETVKFEDDEGPLIPYIR